MEAKTALALFLLYGVVISAVLAKKVNTGDTVTWTCVANWNDEKSPDSYLWYRRYSYSNNTRIPDEEGKTFTKTVRPGDAGYYRCKTVIGKSESDLGFYKKLIVNGPGKPTLQQCPDQETVNTGDTVTWTCVANSNDGESQDSYNYLWYKYSYRKSLLIPGEKGRTFTKNVRPGDAGYYKCKTVIGSSSSDYSPYKKLSVNATETWKTTCSSLWTPWATENLTSNLEHRSQLCGEISSEGGIRNWSLKMETRTRRVSEIAASFRSTKTFTNKLLDETTQEYKDLKEQFEPLLQNAFRSKVASGEMKGVIITGFEEGSVIVHYKIILKVSVSITDTWMNPAVVSKMLVDYLKDNPNEAKRYDIAPRSAGIDGGTKDSQTSSQKSLQNKIDVISAITATLIVILIVTVVVLVVYSIRLKRQVMEKQSSGDGVEYYAGVNGNRQAGVKVKKTNGLDADNTYAAIGEKEPVILNDLYQSLGEQNRIAKPQVSMVSRENAAFETEEADYVNIGKAVFSTVEGSAGVDDDYAIPDGESNANHGNRA